MFSRRKKPNLSSRSLVSHLVKHLDCYVFSKKKIQIVVAVGWEHAWVEASNVLSSRIKKQNNNKLVQQTPGIKTG